MRARSESRFPREDPLECRRWGAWRGTEGHREHHNCAKVSQQRKTVQSLKVRESDFHRVGAPRARRSGLSVLGNAMNVPNTSKVLATTVGTRP